MESGLLSPSVGKDVLYPALESMVWRRTRWRDGLAGRVRGRDMLEVREPRGTADMGPGLVEAQRRLGLEAPV